MGGRHLKSWHTDTRAPQPGDESLIELHRVDVRELESRGYLPTQIATVLKIPYRIVAAVFATKAPPKKSSK